MIQSVAAIELPGHYWTKPDCTVSVCQNDYSVQRLAAVQEGFIPKCDAPNQGKSLSIRRQRGHRFEIVLQLDFSAKSHYGRAEFQIFNKPAHMSPCLRTALIAGQDVPMRLSSDHHLSPKAVDISLNVCYSPDSISSDRCPSASRSTLTIWPIGPNSGGKPYPWFEI